MLELLIFAGIAFFIINKLISKLGSTSDNDPAKQKSSFFGESVIKDVTNNSNGISNNLLEKRKDGYINPMTLDGLIVEENRDAIVKGIETISTKFPPFKPAKFLQNAKLAFELIIEAANDDNINELAKLVDKRYLQEFHTLSEKYGNFVHNNKLEAKISEVYSFANNIFVKILFCGQKITEKIAFFNEEWTFSKNIMSNNVNWFLSNVEQIDDKD